METEKDLIREIEELKERNSVLEKQILATNYEVKQSQLNYDSFFNTIDDFLFVLDTNGNIIYTNKTVADRLGYTSQELVGLSVLMIHPEERREEAGKIVMDMLNGKAEFCPIPIITKDGTQIPVETRVTKGIWDGKPVIFGVTKDISKIQLSEEKFSKVFYLNPSACGLSEIGTGKYLEVNEAFYTLLGFERNEVIGKTVIELGILTPDTIEEIIQKAVINGNISNADAELKAKNGDIKYVILSSENIRIQDKEFRFTVVNDITERKNVEESLIIERQRLNSILEGTNVGTWEWNIQTGETVYNERWAEILGYTLEELSPLNIATWMEYAHPDDLKRSDELLNLHFSGELDYYEFESRMKHKNGDWIWILDRGKVHTWVADGKPLLMSGTHQDITDRINAENEIKKKNSELAELIASKDKFFSIIAHDLKSPISGVLGLAQMMSDCSYEMTMEEMQESSIAMHDSATKLYTLLQNLLEWARFQRGLITFNPELVRINEIVNQNIDFASVTAIGKDISIKSLLTKELTVNVDKNMISTILRNLISNSIKFTPRGGEIEIGAIIKPSEGLEPSEGYTAIFVKDNGIGMNEDTLSKLFRIDKVVNRHGTENEPSTGLGLILCKEFVEKHGGKIWVESEVGNGSTFYFSIPDKSNG